VLFIFFALLQPEIVIVKKFLISFKQPLAIHLAQSVQKLDKAIHWVSHYPGRVSDFLGG